MDRCGFYSILVWLITHYSLLTLHPTFHMGNKNVFPSSKFTYGTDWKHFRVTFENN